MVRKNTLDDFWAAVSGRDNPEGCWLWTGSVTSNGYGCIQIDKVGHLAHRLAYELTHGPIADGLFACHRCDTPLCCNPSHLFLGTSRDNTADRDAKGRARGVKGSANVWAKFTDEQIAEIRRRYREGGGGRHGGISYTDLGREYGMHPQNIGRIIRGEGYQNVDGAGCANPAHSVPPGQAEGDHERIDHQPDSTLVAKRAGHG